MALTRGRLAGSVTNATLGGRTGMSHADNRAMRSFLRAAAAAATLFLAACAIPPTHPSLQGSAAVQVPLLPVHDIVANWDAQGAWQVSPDGRRLLWMARRGLGPGLFVRDLESGATRSYPVRGLGQWARDSRHVLVHLDRSGDENSHLLRFDASAEALALHDLTPFAGAKSHLHARLDDSDDLLIESNRRDPKVFDLYRWLAGSGELRLLARNPGDIGMWLTDRQGRLVGRAARRGLQWVFETPPAVAGANVDADVPWSPRFTVDFFEAVQPLGVTEDGAAVWALSNRGRDRLALVRLALDSGAETVLFEDARVDVTQVLTSRRTGAPLAVSLDPDVQQWLAIDPAFAPVLQRLRGGATVPQRLEVLGLSDDDNAVVALRTRGDGGEHVLYQRGADRLTELSVLTRTRLRARSPLGEPQPMRWRSGDGLALHGYLTVPPGAPAGPLPTVLYVHGGPWARDVHLGGDPMPLFLANRGYAVLQVNYRGSTGYGRTFRDAAQGEFAGRMHTDLTDALDALVAQGVTDPARVAILGASYGGYASLVGMTFTPERFACGISVVGMSDLVSLLENAPPYWELGLPMWRRFAGDPGDPAGRARLQARSPLHRAAQARGPILLLHGVHDPRVKVDQSLRMAQALREAGRPVELELFDGAGHGFHRWPDQLRYYRRTEDFLAACLGGRSAGFDLFEPAAWVLR